MSVDAELQEQIELLVQKYEHVYGKKPDLSDFSFHCSFSRLSQKTMVQVLQRMIDENESFIVAYHNLF